MLQLQSYYSPITELKITERNFAHLRFFFFHKFCHPSDVYDFLVQHKNNCGNAVLEDRTLFTLQTLDFYFTA